MLNQRIDILEASAPFLLSLPNNVWHLIIKIEKLEAEHYLCHCVKNQDNEFTEYTKDILEVPFHVAENIWELSYGVEIMTLMDDSLNDHPARILWQNWNAHKHC